mgnify:CR=1 FL=1
MFVDESTITGCNFYNNTATSMTLGGGELYLHGEETKVIDCEFEGNSAKGSNSSNILA